MHIELTVEQIRSILVLLSRVNIKGNEALGVVILQQVFERALQTPIAQPTEEPSNEEE